MKKKKKNADTKGGRETGVEWNTGARYTSILTTVLSNAAYNI